MRWLLLLCLGCSTASLPALPKASGDTATFLVPGYKGSFLADEQGERRWITPSQALSSGDESLALPGPRALHPDGPVTRLSIFGIGETAYLPLLEFARDRLPGPVAFSYDWRQDVRESARRLCAAIAAAPVARVDLVVHSMGGLVALHCLRQGALKVRRVAFLGTPFAGSAKISADLLRGDHALRNRALLSADALFTFASSWQLLPPALPAISVQTLGRPAADEPQLARMLAAHDGHWRELEGFVPAVPVLAVIGEGRSTPAALRFEDVEHLPQGDGDGLVTSASARPSFAHEEFRTKAEHSEMLGDRDVQAALLRFLQGGPK